ncbi:hypothetical protein F7725_027686 [Dissostichus mawsoni]|uniref:Sec1 family domain-containing protein 2 n=1 Tax=Dissostichus mawsoni TaxID=36200 RepID=A0A7J5XFY6_DISMA|nr:hypothetical protein F7725_027686 [Dissostichus mawsoni]
MDITGAVGHHGDNLVEKILSVLKPLPGHVTDVQVDMLELTSLQRTPHSQTTLAPGCLAQTQSPAAQTLWEAMLTNKHKEGVMEWKQQQREAANQDEHGPCDPEQLCSYMQLFKSSWGALESHCGVSSWAWPRPRPSATPACPAGMPAWPLKAAAADSDFPAVLRQLLPLMKPRGGEDSTTSGSRSGEDESGPDEMILLLVYLYSLADEAQPADQDTEEEEVEKLERELIGVLTLVLTREIESAPWSRNSPELTTERAHSAVEKMFDTLRGLSHARDHLKQLRSVYIASDGVHQATYRPFLRQILEEVFRPDRPECPDIDYMSGGLTDLLKTGFSMFMKVSRPHPGDNPLLFLFLVGGVTPAELRLIKESVSTHKPGTQVLVLSTRLLRPTDIPELLFTTQRLLPDIDIIKNVNIRVCIPNRNSPSKAPLKCFSARVVRHFDQAVLKVDCMCKLKEACCCDGEYTQSVRVHSHLNTSYSDA